MNLILIWMKWIWFRFGFDLIQIWFRSGFDLVRIWLGPDLDLIWIWFGSEINLIRIWFGYDLDVMRSDSDIGLIWIWLGSEVDIKGIYWESDYKDHTNRWQGSAVLYLQKKIFAVMLRRSKIVVMTRRMATKDRLPDPPNFHTSIRT